MHSTRVASKGKKEREWRASPYWTKEVLIIKFEGVGELERTWGVVIYRYERRVTEGHVNE